MTLEHLYDYSGIPISFQSFENIRYVQAASR